ncbi:hypothetical protein GCM10008905_08850 [Clostridium malenominatum]|uniref:Uncharacterized protein n=1 Tax=Clostridium malenominatum TaxID=1539 RepID=A0ABN1IRN9_9CLOT
MKNKFLHELQEDILDGKGYITLYKFLFIPAFIITIENPEFKNPKLYSEIFRVALSSIALLFSFLVYLKCKATRDEKENKEIINYTFLFLLLTFFSVYQLIKN